MTGNPNQSRWPTGLATMLLWSLAAASITFWAIRLAAPEVAEAAPPAIAPAFIDNVRASQPALGWMPGALQFPAAQRASGAASQNFILHGVIVGKAGQGTALLSVDGQPARPLTVGAQIAPGWVLESVSQLEAVLHDSTQGRRQVISLLSRPQVTAVAATPAAAVNVAATEKPAAIAAVGTPTPATAEFTAVASAVAAPVVASGPPPRLDSRYAQRSPRNLH